MNMKIRFVYSNIYFRNLNRFKKTKNNWDYIKNLGKEFEAEYSDRIKSITSIIQQIVGRKWEDEIIKVYITDWIGPSFSHPLTLKARKDKLLMFVILIHELIHQLYFNEEITKGKEIEINKMVKEVLNAIELKADEQLSKLRNYSER